jgi:hypothetical protein
MNRDNIPDRITIGFFDLLSLLFIALKLCHVIDWSWVWVLAPIWTQFLGVFLIAVIFILYKGRKS